MLKPLKAKISFDEEKFMEDFQHWIDGWSLHNDNPTERDLRLYVSRNVEYYIDYEIVAEGKNE